MTLRSSKSDLMGRLENVIDDHEEYIGSKVWAELEFAFNDVDDDAKQLEDDLEEANERIKELEERIEKLEDGR